MAVMSMSMTNLIYTAQQHKASLLLRSVLVS